MKTKSWFEVSTEGLRQLQAGKPIHHIARELIQNAWDENIIHCIFSANWLKGRSEIIVKDDNPEGFKDLSHAFTLFAPTSKRLDVSKRGRFNLGEKQAIVVAENTIIKTTKGTVIFDKKGRTHKQEKTDLGSEIKIIVRMTKPEYEEMLSEVKTYLVPENIQFSVNGELISYRKPFKTINARLLTEVDVEGVLKRVERDTDINILQTTSKARLYEMGLPITEIECEYDIDVQQKVPLSVDRETVPQSYLSALYAEVLNATYKYVNEEKSSDVWIREATSNKRINTEAVKEIVNKRFGENVVVANPFDKNSIDEAISSGYRVVYGSEMSKEEWNNIKNADAIKSSSDLFGSNFVNSKTVEPDENMLKVSELAKRIAKRCLDININVCFSEWDGCAAQYGEKILTFNVKALGKNFFNPALSAKVIDLLLHEIAHEKGNHTEKSYHQAITQIASELVIIALTEPSFFSI